MAAATSVDRSKAKHQSKATLTGGWVEASPSHSAHGRGPRGCIHAPGMPSVIAGRVPPPAPSWGMPASGAKSARSTLRSLAPLPSGQSRNSSILRRGNMGRQIRVRAASASAPSTTPASRSSASVPASGAPHSAASSCSAGSPGVVAIRESETRGGHSRAQRWMRDSTWRTTKLSPPSPPPPPPPP
ncbi:MAG: hypothetical protein J3K34DRAFT_409724 [Monoraphidium minutum]|nr:MAG: hypothetical protein J3K34DRAFT_409724 [Monoraphidium minutum]